MKKNFSVIDSKIKPARRFEAIKYEVRKYLGRERRKPLPDGADFWDFDCRFGADEASCEVIHPGDINKNISRAEADNLETFYLEILAKPGYRQKKPKVAEVTDVENAASGDD